MIGRAATGTDNIDAQTARERGISVLATPGANADAVAELALGLMIDALRQVSSRSATLHSGSWEAATGDLPARGLADVSVGIVGTGAVGRRVARLADVFGATLLLLGSQRFTSKAVRDVPGRRVASLEELLTGSDVVSLHIPATPQTRHLINTAALRKMRPGSVLVNTARGSILDEDAVDRALRDPAEPLAWLAADVFNAEGNHFSSVLAGNPYCTLTPHIAGMTRSAMREASSQLVEKFRDMLMPHVAE